MWDSIPSHIIEIDSVNEFKHAIKTWKPDLCSCRLRKVYSQKKYIYVYKNTYMSKIRISSCFTLYIYFSLFSYLLESMEFI